MSASTFHFFLFKKSISRALWVLCRKRKQNYDFSVGPVHCSWDPQVLYSKKKKKKPQTHSAIHTFKNYFSTVFSVFNIQQNKRYSNRPLVFVWDELKFSAYLQFYLIFSTIYGFHCTIKLIFQLFFYIFNKKISISTK